ncbi:hypothetical protein Q8F55_006414 [Vanrija albida]|uniref:Uncharacterized protein n=1 Tax=Vanrija albida TaxID=181172 RepID=A0ABR3PX26_9TREE
MHLHPPLLPTPKHLPLISSLQPQPGPAFQRKPPPRPFTLPIAPLVEVNRVASPDRGSLTFTAWLDVVVGIHRDINDPTLAHFVSNREVAIPSCPMKITASVGFVSALGFVNPHYTRVGATLIDLRVVDLKSFHFWADRPLTALALFDDLLTPPADQEATTRLDGMKTATIAKIRKHWHRAARWNVNQVTMFIAAMWAWDVAPEYSWDPLGTYTDDWGYHRDADPKVRYIYELVRFYDPSAAELRPACEAARMSLLPHSLFHPVFSRDKCVACFCSKAECIVRRE